MDQVVTKATIDNFEEIGSVERGLLPPRDAGKIMLPDALVESGATSLSLPTRLIGQLGLPFTGTKRVTGSGGHSEANIYESVRLTIQDRSCTMNVWEVPDGVPVLIGQLPLEHFDRVIDMRSHAPIGNRAHGDAVVNRAAFAYNES